MSNDGPLRLLLSARDPAAAQNIAAVCHALAADPRFALEVVAQQPAHAILRSRGVAARELPGLRAHTRDDADAGALLSLAKQLLDQLRPDVVLSGLSSPTPAEGGIDEALFACAGVPTLMLQDFWGELNAFFGAPPQVALVLDEHAAQQTAARHGTPTRVVGSPRHGEYAGFDSAAARQRVRERFVGRSPAAYIGLFGQPLHRLGGYRRTIEAWMAEVESLPAPVRVIYRPHPREDAQQVRTTVDWLEALRVEHVTLRDGPPEAALAACDVACTVFSNCAYDAAYLNYFSAQPLVSPLLMLFDEELLGVLACAGDYRRLPYIARGLTLPVWRREGLGPALRLAAQGPYRQQLWDAARTVLHDPRLAVTRIADEVLHRAGRLAQVEATR